MKKSKLVSALVSIYFGAALSFAGLSLLDWQWWAIFIPVTIGHVIHIQYEKAETKK